jgi:hypothetical protein
MSPQFNSGIVEASRFYFKFCMESIETISKKIARTFVVSPAGETTNVGTVALTDSECLAYSPQLENTMHLKLTATLLQNMLFENNPARRLLRA